MSKIKYVCKNCNIDFYDYEYRNRNYCSKNCANSSIERNTRIGNGNKISLLNHTHSLKTKQKMSERKTGSKHWNWQGGITNITRALKNGIAYRNWRNSVFERNDYTCQAKDCQYCKNKKGVFLHAHHIKSFKRYNKLRYDINNGITYCSKYHLKSGIHKKKGDEDFFN